MILHRLIFFLSHKTTLEVVRIFYFFSIPLKLKKKKKERKLWKLFPAVHGSLIASKISAVYSETVLVGDLQSTLEKEGCL